MSHLKVAVRIRPFSEREIGRGYLNITTVEKENVVAITNLKVPEDNSGDSRERIRRFKFDYCFFSLSTQSEVYDKLGSEIKMAIGKRQHSCVLAYGQSASGKTHTIMGNVEDPGLTMRLCQNLFRYLEKYSVNEEELQMLPVISFLEIYNEKVRDLLDSNSNAESVKTLRVREHPQTGPYVQGLTQRSAHNPETLLNWLVLGNSNRKVSATSSNPNSSRSHSLFTVRCFKDVQIHLIDLAGSERTTNENQNIAILKEGSSINKSLVALGNVISKLGEKSSKNVSSFRKRFVPYRDSILTWLLKDILGGNSNTIVIATISPANSCYCETINTLRFGQRAKKIITHPIANEDPKDRTIRLLRVEITRLKQLLAEQDSVSSLECRNVEAAQLSGKLSTSNVLLQPDRKLFLSAEKYLKSEKLVPVLNVTSSVQIPNMEKRRTTRPFGSQEAISNVSKDKLKRLSQPSLTLHKGAFDKSSIPLKRLVTRKTQDEISFKPEIGVITEQKGSSIKKPSSVERSKIVAAVTNRLYTRTRTKEVAVETNTNPENVETSQELTICSNARMRLQELTQRALKASRGKDVETQTDLFPVLRVKEVSTDINGLKLPLENFRDVETFTDKVIIKDVGITCMLESFNEHFSDFNKFLLVTRTCGTQSQEIEKFREPHSYSSISFTKYIQDRAKPSFEVVNPSTANPIFTNSVNINVSHNYANQDSRLHTEASSDSLEEQPHPPNVPFSTPDIISNHNSLEPTAIITFSSIIEKYANYNATTEVFKSCESFPRNLPNICFSAFSFTTNQCKERITNIQKLTVYATQICIAFKNDERCIPIWRTFCQEHWVTVTRHLNELYVAVTLIPVVSKSVSKRQILKNKGKRFCDENKLCSTTSNVPMIDAISKFFDEAHKLVQNLAQISNKLQTERTYDIEVTLNNISIPDGKGHEEVASQITHKAFVEASSNTDIPKNHYDEIVSDSCKRLQQCIRKVKHEPNSEFFTGKRIWDTKEDNLLPFSFTSEHSSLESHQTFSDYGSLPRLARTNPSDYLQQLRRLRRRVVESSRENIFPSS